MKLTLATSLNVTAGTIDVSEVTFGREYNEALVHQVVVAALARARQGTHQTKSRSDCSGSGKKPWAQKGTGNARAGCFRSPLWRSGGHTFAARPGDYSHKVNKKMHRGAMQSILSELNRQKRLLVVEDFSIEQPKTKELLKKLKDFGLERVLIVVDKMNDNLYLASRNIPRVEVITVDHVDPVNLIKYDHVLMTVHSVRKCEEVLA